MTESSICMLKDSFLWYVVLFILEHFHESQILNYLLEILSTCNIL